MNKTTIINELDTTDANLRKDGEALENAMNDAFSQEREVCRLRLKAEEAKRTILVANAPDVKALGSNEATRDATIAAMCATEIAALKDAEDELASRKHDVSIYSLRIDYTKRRMSMLQSVAALLASGE